MRKKEREVLHPEEFLKQALEGRTDFSGIYILVEDTGGGCVACVDAIENRDLDDSHFPDKDFDLSDSPYLDKFQKALREGDLRINIDKSALCFNADEICFFGASAFRTRFSGRFRGANFNNTYLNEAEFLGRSDLSHARFYYYSDTFYESKINKIKYAHFSCVNLYRTRFRPVHWCNFNRADLREAYIAKAIHCSFEEADLRGMVDLRGIEWYSGKANFGESPFGSCYFNETKVTKDLEKVLKDKLCYRQLDVYENVPELTE